MAITEQRTFLFFFLDGESFSNIRHLSPTNQISMDWVPCLHAEVFGECASLCKRNITTKFKYRKASHCADFGETREHCGKDLQRIGIFLISQQNVY